MKTILFLNARNEDNILEWVVHHLNLGFDHIFITDHKSIDPIKNKLSCLPSHLITVERNDGDIMKNILIINAHKYAINNKYDWMIYLDADEFIIFNEDNNVNDFLKKYEDYDQVSLNWLLLGSNGHSKIPCDTILSSYTKSDELLNVHVKSFLNLNKINTHKMDPQPHIYYLNDMTKSISVNYAPLIIEHPYWYPTDKKYYETPAYVAHYLFQSYETYLKRKISIPRDDNGLFRDIIPEHDFHAQYNGFVNMTIKDKYDLQNKNKIIEIIQSTQQNMCNVEIPYYITMPQKHIEPTYIEPIYIEPTHIELTHIEPTHIEPTHIEPIQSFISEQNNPSNTCSFCLGIEDCFYCKF